MPRATPALMLRRRQRGVPPAAGQRRPIAAGPSSGSMASFKPTPRSCARAPETPTPRSTTSTSARFRDSLASGRRSRAARGRARRRGDDADPERRSADGPDDARAAGRPAAGDPGQRLQDDRADAVRRARGDRPGQGPRRQGAEASRAAAHRLRADPFGQPEWLWLLAFPALLARPLGLALLSAAGRHPPARRAPRTMPVPSASASSADLPFWLCLTGRDRVPRRGARRVRTGRQRSCARAASTSSSCSTDPPRCASRMSPAIAGSARAVPSAARRSMGWKNDRIALALFARIAAPQVRLTTDPEHLLLLPRQPREGAAVPARAKRPRWDTNLEHGIHWGLRMIEKDEELHGRSSERAAVRMPSPTASPGAARSPKP